MADLSDLLRSAAERRAASYSPPADLSQRIAVRTLQLQRRRRMRVVGAAAIAGVLLLAVPVLLKPGDNSSNQVSVDYAPLNVKSEEPKSTTTTLPLPTLPSPAQMAALSAHERSKVLKDYAAALKKKKASDERAKRDDTRVLDASATRPSATTKKNGGGASTSTTKKRTTSTTKPKPTSTTKASTTTTRPPTTTTTAPPATTTTQAPTTTTTTAAPIVPLQIVAPEFVCAGVPAVFHATGTGADLVLWSNLQVGATATYVLTESTTIAAVLELDGTTSSQSYGVQVIPTGTAPC